MSQRQVNLDLAIVLGYNSFSLSLSAKHGENLIKLNLIYFAQNDIYQSAMHMCGSPVLHSNIKLFYNLNKNLIHTSLS